MAMAVRAENSLQPTLRHANEASSGPVSHGAIGVGSWNTSVEYKDIVVTSNGTVLYQSDFFHQGTNDWRVYQGAWSIQDGVLRQTGVSRDCRATFGDTNWANYTITLRARKLDGNEGFLVLFNWCDDKNFTWFNVGRQGESACVEQYVDGSYTVLGGEIPQTIESSIWYNLRVVLSGPRIQCYVNARLVADYTRLNGKLEHDRPRSGPIHSIGDVLAMSGSDSIQGHTVHAEGVAVYADPIKSEVLFKDDTGAIPVPVDLRKTPISPGTRVALDGQTSAQLTRYPDHPSGSQYLKSFDAPVNVDDLYFARVRGFLTPPRTGDYTFWIASDNGSELWLSPDADPQHAKKIAWIDAFNYVPFHAWDQSTNQRSAKITLEAGKKYYVEALHWEQIGEDFLAVAWEGPELPRTVIDGAFLSPPAAGENPADVAPSGSILREFWLKYPFASNAESEKWRITAAAAADPSIEGLMKNPPTHYGKPVITLARLTPLGEAPPPLARAISLEQPWTEAEDYQWVEAQGVISQIASANSYWTILVLTDGGRQMTVRLPNPRQENLDPWVNARVAIHGFCEGALASGGRRVASVLWVPGLQDISISPPVDADWARLPLFSIHDLNSNTTARAGQRIRIAGEWVGKQDDFQIVRDTVSRFTAYISTDGNNWKPVGNPIEMPMKDSVYAGIATCATAPNKCTVTYDHPSAALFPGTLGQVGVPPSPGSLQVGATNLVITGTGRIGGRAGIDAFRNDDCDFLYRRLDGDGEIVAHLSAISVDAVAWLGGTSGLMLRQSLEPNSKMLFLAASTLSGIDLRVRRDAGNPIEGFPNGAAPPCWLKLVRQSPPPIKVSGTRFPGLAPGQLIEVMGVLACTNREWTLHDAFCKITATEAMNPDVPVPQGEITTVKQIRRLGADELELSRQARIDGVITAKPDDIYVQDDTGGIRIPANAAQKFAGLGVGQRISLVGHFAPGGYSPMLEPGQQADAVTWLGAGRMPEPRVQTRIQLMLGQQDAQWIEVKGVIRSIQGRRLKLQMAGGDILAELDFDLPADRRERLIASAAHLQGVWRVTADGKKQLTGGRLLVPKAEFIFVDEATPVDPFSVTAQSINQLRPGNQTELVHRVKIEGVVTYAHDGMAYLQDTTGGIEVSAGATALGLGDRVEVLGFPDSNGSSVSLADVQIRKSATGALPAPMELRSGVPLAAHASRLVAMNAVFLGHSTLLDNDVLQLQSRDRIFQGLLPKDCGALPELELGSLVHLTGVCRIFADPAGKYSEANPGFELLFSAPANVALLKAPPWWNWHRLLWVGGSFLGVLTLAVTWIVMILRKNRLLKLAQRQLQTANEELEARVKHRTADLARANAELRYEQGLFRTLLDTASDYIYFKDADSRLVRCSLSLCARAELTHPQIVGRTDFDIFRPEYARMALADEQQILRTGQPLIGKLEQEVHPDNLITWLMTTKMPWRDAAGKIIGTFGISRDITPLKEAEARLERVHQQLVDASRVAGQAEVAASVLHNVGNVLNSVNISVGLLQSRVQASKSAASILRVAGLLQQPPEDLARFFSPDGRGHQLLPYLQGLAEQIAAEQAGLLAEMNSLTNNVDHIKVIVARQQNYTRVGAVTEVQSVPALVEDALRVQASGLEALQIRVVRQFAPVPEMPLDKHRVLQILGNLISNAQWALRESPAPERVLTVSIGRGQDRRLQISVADNGIGISPENLGHLFRHGFTTRSNGHGLGLHTSILAARELGGDLLAQSNGPGWGAVFTLEIPCAPNQPSATDDKPAGQFPQRAAPVPPPTTRSSTAQMTPPIGGKDKPRNTPANPSQTSPGLRQKPPTPSRSTAEAHAPSTPTIPPP